MNKIHFQTITENLLLPIINTYSKHNADELVFFDELEHYVYLYEYQKKELKKLISLNDIKENYFISERILNNDINQNDIFEPNYEKFEFDCIGLLEDYGVEFINTLNKHFSNFIIDSKIIDKIEKPREYNFKTDKTLIEFIFNSEILHDVIEFFKNEICIKNEIDLQTFLKDNFSSYDGFMSFTSNNIEDFLNSIINEDNTINIDSVEFDLMLGIIYHYIINNNSIKNINDSINRLQSNFDYGIYEDTYIEILPTENFNEFYYSIDELQNIIENNIIRLKQKHYKKFQLKIF